MRGAKFVVIVLIMHIGIALSCCVNPRRYACSAGEECAKNPKHCTSCHKKPPTNVRVKRAAYNRAEIETQRDHQKADQYQRKTTLRADDLAEAANKVIDNEISNDIDTEIDSQTSTVTLIFLNASYTLKDTQESLSVENSTVHEPISSTQEQTSPPEQYVSPQQNLKKKLPKTYQRGILDLLFPAARVLTFKAYLEALKRFLSATF